MAIVIEQEENGANVVRVLTWFVVLAIIAAAAYYIFFAQPELVEVVAPGNFQNIDPLSGVTVNPEEIVNGPAFQSLKQYVAPPAPGNSGRSNPFQPF